MRARNARTPMQPPRSPAPSQKWQAAQAGVHYAGARWSSARRAQRDPRAIDSLLRRHLRAPSAASRAQPLVLDAPCGTGRMQTALAAHGRVLGLDASASMLKELPAPAPRVLGLVERLPFADASFDAVVCVRLLHHLHSERELEAVLSELVRVSRDLVLASFWDSSAWPSWRARLGFTRSEPAHGRRARSRAQLRAALVRAGAELLEFRGSPRFLSQQAYFAARKRGAR